MKSLGIRRIRSSSTNPRRSNSNTGTASPYISTDPTPYVRYHDNMDNININNIDHNDAISGGGGGGGRSGITNGNFVQKRPMYDVDVITGLEKHRRLSSLETELRRCKETAATALQDVHNREQEIISLKSEHIKIRQQLETVIRDLLEKQRNISMELEQSHKEIKFLREEAVVMKLQLNTARETQQELIQKEESSQLKLQEELKASESREAEVVNELSIVMEKLTKADTYIQTLSDEAVEYQMEIERLRNQLYTKSTMEQKEKEEENNIQSKLHISQKIEAEETVRKKKALGELWAGLAMAVLTCAESCDDVSRECDELIDVIKEEQQRAEERYNAIFVNTNRTDNTDVKSPIIKGDHQRQLTFISCKPTGAELDQLLRATCSQQQQGGEENNEGKEDVKDDAMTAWEGTTRVITQLISGMHRALCEAKNDVLIAGRAYAELCRVGRGLIEEVTALRITCGEERATIVKLEEQITEVNKSLHIEKERANQLQASLDETADIMTEAATLAEERTLRMDKLLHDNALMEEALQSLRKSLRERDDIIASTERRLQTLQSTMHKEQTEFYTAQEELNRTKRIVTTLQGELDAARLHNQELEHRLEMLKEESQQCDVDRLYLRKCVEELQGQLTHMHEDRQGLRGAKEAVEWEKRQLLVQIDRLRRNGNEGQSNNNNNNSEGAKVHNFSPSFSLAPKQQQGEKKEEEGMGSGMKKRTTQMGPSDANRDVVLSPRPTQTNESMDKVRWWEAKLQAITSSAPSSTSLFATSSTYRDDNKKMTEDMQKLAVNSATLASLAYGTPLPYRDSE